MSAQLYTSRADWWAIVLFATCLICVLLAAFHYTALPLAAWIGAFGAWLSLKGENA